MTDELMLALFCLVPIVLLAFALTLTKRVDKGRIDYVAQAKRRITRNAFKARLGIR